MPDAPENPAPKVQLRAPMKKALVWAKGDNPIKPLSKTELSLLRGASSTWTWIKGDTPVKPLSKIELTLVKGAKTGWTWVKGDNPTKPRKKRKVPKAGTEVRNRTGKRLEKMKEVMKERIPKVKFVVEKLGVKKDKKNTRAKGEAVGLDVSGSQNAPRVHPPTAETIASSSDEEESEDEGGNGNASRA